MSTPIDECCDACVTQCKAVADHLGKPFDAQCEAAVRQHCKEVLGGKKQMHAAAAGLPPWLTPILQAVLAALLSALAGGAQPATP